MNICVLIATMNDLRVKNCVISLLKQKMDDEFWILIGDGGSKQGILNIYRELTKESKNMEIDLIWKVFPGNVTKTREAAFEYAIASGCDLIAVIDADEIAPPQWLDRLTGPLRMKIADFSFGPTRPVMEGATWVTKYVYFEEARMYRMVKDGLLWYGAMGNSCWSSRMLKALKEKYGYYINTELPAGEDSDLTLRALKEGYKGKFVEEAWVWHDRTSIKTLRDLIKKMTRYLHASYHVYTTENIDAKESLKRYFKYGIHPLDFLPIVIYLLIHLKAKSNNKQKNVKL